MGAAEPSALALHPALLVRAVDAGLAVEAVEPVVRPERHPLLGLQPVAPEQHPRHRRLEIVVADPVERHPAEGLERVHVPLDERLLPLRGEHPVHRPARRRQPQREQEAVGQYSVELHPQISEVDLSLRARRMRLRHERLLDRPARLRRDLGPASRDVVAHRRVRQPREPVLVDQPRQHPPRRVTLLARRVEILAQHRVDQRLRRIKLRRPPHRRLPRRRHRRLQRLPHRPPTHMMTACQLPDRQPLTLMIPANPLEQLHPRPRHLTRPPLDIAVAAKR